MLTSCVERQGTGRITSDAACEGDKQSNGKKISVHFHPFESSRTETHIAAKQQGRNSRVKSKTRESKVLKNSRGYQTESWKLRVFNWRLARYYARALG